MLVLFLFLSSFKHIFMWKLWKFIEFSVFIDGFLFSLSRAPQTEDDELIDWWELKIDVYLSRAI